MALLSSSDTPYWDRPPERWRKCPRKSDLICDRFVAFKAPLKSKYDEYVPLEDRFTVDMLLQSVARSKRRIGLWIDLTKTSRFYDSEDFVNIGIRYMKIPCSGHDGPPDYGIVKSFIDACDSLTESSAAHGSAPPLIAVHCTHGFNRTGFLICSYFVERLNCDPELAFEWFRKARPPGIYKEEYIHEFFRRYDPAANPPLAPELPMWCSFEDGSAIINDRNPQLSIEYPNKEKHSRFTPDASGQLAQQQNQQQSGVLSPVERIGGNDAVSRDFQDELDADAFDPAFSGSASNQPVVLFFNGQVPEVEQVIDDGQVRRLRLLCDKYCNPEVKDETSNVIHRKRISFPGTQPVSMDLNNINFLHSDYYRVSWKADGMRYMMLIENTSCIYMVDREFNFFRVPYIEFPSRKSFDVPVQGTLLDGEMILDTIKDADGKKIGTRPRYLIYDIMHFMNKPDVAQCNFDKRMECIRFEIISPRVEYTKQKRMSTTQDPFSVRQKDFFSIEKADSILNGTFAEHLPHDVDGLVFQPWRDPYTPGTCERILKWKPPHLNSIDFLIKLRKIPERTGQLPETKAELRVKGRDSPFAVVPATRELRNMDNKIVEMSVDLATGKWRFIKERVDKNTPNHVRTAEAVWRSITNPVTEKILLDFIKTHGKKSSSANTNGTGVKRPLLPIDGETRDAQQIPALNIKSGLQMLQDPATKKLHVNNYTLMVKTELAELG